jgi:hypothetical protein
MKQVKPTVLFAFMLCVLIGYFEPANAARLIAPPAATTAYVAMNSTTNVCPFWPNPIAPTSSLTAISFEVVTGGTIQAAGGKPSSVSVIAYNQPFPLGVVENNAYFVPDLYPSLTGTTLALPSLADGNYVLTINTQSGHVYTTKLTILSK